MKKAFIAFAVLATLVSVDNMSAKKRIGIQLYSVREVFNANNYAESHETVFSALAKMGYTDVEPAGYGNGKFYGATPEQFKADLQAAGLNALSSHTTRSLTRAELDSHDFTEALKWWDQCIADHKTIGCKYIVVPHMGVPATLKDLKTACGYLNIVGKKCAEQGIQFGYHNHSHEFKKVEDAVMLDYMIQNTDPKYVFFEMDVYWTMMGQASPVEYFKKYPGRFQLLHIKDKTQIGQSGMVGFDAIFANTDIAGMKYFIVEQERTELPEGILEGVRQGANYLKKAKFVKKSYCK